MKRLMLVLLPLLGCTSNEYIEGALKLKWSPPSGVKLEAESTEGALTTARFSGGVEVRAVAATPPPTTGDLDALMAQLIEATKMPSPGAVRMGRSGSIPNGPTVRWEMQSGPNRSLLYYVPGKDRYVLISMVAPASAFDRKSDKFELSLASLKVY